MRSAPCVRMYVCVSTGMLAVAIKLASDRVCAKTFPVFCVRHKKQSHVFPKTSRISALALFAVSLTGVMFVVKSTAFAVSS